MGWETDRSLANRCKWNRNMFTCTPLYSVLIVLQDISEELDTVFVVSGNGNSYGNEVGKHSNGN